MNKMSPEHRVGYIDGVVEGLAYSRWLKDRPSEKGMRCIYSWYHNGKKERWQTIFAWLKRHPDKPVGALLYVLIKKECGA